jgi:RNA polymerase sigma-70 factor, ECF subfamily
MASTSHRIQMDDDAIKDLASVDRIAATDLIIRKYRQPIFQHAAYILKDYEEAIDVAQEVFIKALRERRFFDPGFKMKAWLYRVTSNLCFNMVRDRRRRSAILDTMTKRRSSDADQIDLVVRGEQQRGIFAAMETISENHRRILLLRYYKDLSYAEIATALDIKLGTVMSRLSRAKRSLLEAIEGADLSAA